MLQANLRSLLHDLDFLLRQPIEPVDHLIDQPVGALDPGADGGQLALQLLQRREIRGEQDLWIGRIGAERACPWERCWAGVPSSYVDYRTLVVIEQTAHSCG